MSTLPVQPRQDNTKTGGEEKEEGAGNSVDMKGSNSTYAER